MYVAPPPINPNYNPSNPLYSPVSYYGYIPNLGFNVFASIVWGLVALVHVYWMVSKQGRRTSWIQALFVLGSVWELADYVIRSIGHSSPFRAPLFATQYIGNLFTPIFFIIALQLGLLKALTAHTEHASLLFGRPRPIIKTLIGYSILVFIINVIGSTLYLVGTNRKVQNIPHSGFDNDAGVHVLLTAQGNQVALLTITQGVLTWILINIFRNRRSNAPSSNSTLSTGTVRPLIYGMLFLTFGMLWVEAIFRLCETCQGWFGVVWSSETYYGIFEFAQVFTAVAIWAGYPFWRYFVDEERKYIKRESV